MVHFYGCDHKVLCDPFGLEYQQRQIKVVLDSVWLSIHDLGSEGLPKSLMYCRQYSPVGIYDPMRGISPDIVGGDGKKVIKEDT